MILWFLSLFRRTVPMQPAWLVDREGVVYQPTRRVVLKAREKWGG
jgi:hypothetical protein